MHSKPKLLIADSASGKFLPRVLDRIDKNSFEISYPETEDENSLIELAKNADSITCCLSKGLSAPVGSLIMGDEELIYKAHRIRKSLGGGMRQSGILAAAGIYSFDNMINRLEQDHENAQLLAKELSEIDEIKIDLSTIHTNILFFNLQNTNIKDEDLIIKLLNNNIKIDSKGNRKFRMVTHYGFEKEDIETVIIKLKNILKK